MGKHNIEAEDFDRAPVDEAQGVRGYSQEDLDFMEFQVSKYRKRKSWLGRKKAKLGRQWRTWLSKMVPPDESDDERLENLPVWLKGPLGRVIIGVAAMGFILGWGLLIMNYVSNHS